MLGTNSGINYKYHTLYTSHAHLKITFGPMNIRSVIDTKESDGVADPLGKIAIKSHSDHSDSGIGKMLI